MRAKSLLLTSMVLAGLAGCGGGDVNLGVSTTDNSVDNSGGGGGGGGGDGVNPCASYVNASNVTRRGSFDGENCTYSSTFVGANNPMLVDLEIPIIPGVHIFRDSLFMGQNVTTGAAPAAGTGPTLTIEAGNTLVFTDSADYVLINRGSRIVAEGSPGAPITFTGFEDAVGGTAGPEDVQLWGGLVINGNGITNNCNDQERAANQCHVVAEGQPSNYGGADNADDSGVLRYVVVKHAGFEVAPGDELNGITLNAVGSGTIMENIQVYSTYDDGVEFFGGAASITNLIAMYVRDDSIDYSDGWVGSIQNALVIQSETNGNRCIEADNIGEGRSNVGEAFDTPPISNGIISNLTCITSNFDAGTHGDAEGPLFRQGTQFQLADSIIFGGYGTIPLDGTTPLNAPSNECFEIEHAATLAFAAAGDSTILNTIIVCEEATKGTFANGDPVAEFVSGANPSTNGANYSFNSGNVIITDARNANVQVLEPASFYTATTLVDAAGTTFTVGSGQVGAVTRADDWTTNWAYGLVDGNRGQPLWFE